MSTKRRKNQKADENDIPKNVNHSSRAAAEAVISTTVIHKNREKRGVRYYEGVWYDPDGSPHMGTEIEQNKVRINRATTELSGAFPYIFDFVNYICTHAKELVQLGDTESYYYMVTVPWEFFLDITLGNFTEQRQSLITEIWLLMTKQQIKVIPYDDDTSIYSHPLRIAMRSKSRKELEAADLNRYNNLNIDPIGEIQIEFMKPLFKDVIDGTRFISAPKAFHALLVKTAREIIGILNSPLFNQAIANNRNAQSLIQAFGGNIPFCVEPMGSADKKLLDKITENTPTKKEADSQHIIAYARFWHYLTLHYNGKGDYITVSLPDMFSCIEAQFVQEKNGVLYIRDYKAVSRFLQVALGIFSQLQTPETDFLIEGIEPTKNKNEMKIIIKRQYPRKK